MKIVKYLAIALGLVAIMLATAWFLRNSIIQRISNPLLQQYGVKVTDVSLDALATSNASISYLQLEHVNGTIISIDNLTLPLGKASRGFKTYTAEKVAIELPPGQENQSPGLARLLEQLLALPSQLPNTEVIVTGLSTSPYPTIRDIRWRSAENNQQLSALVESTLLTAKITRTNTANHVLDVAYTDAAGTTAQQSIAINNQQTDNGVNLSGTATLDLPLWMPIIAMLGVDTVDIESGSARLRFDTEFLYDMNQMPDVHAEIAPTSPLKVTYSSAPDAITSVTIESAGSFEITASFADFQWVLRQPQASLLVSHDQWIDIPVSLIDFSCRSGPACEGDISIIMENAALPFANVDRVEFTAAQNFLIREDGIQVLVMANATLGMTGISGPGVELARIDALLTSAAELQLRDDGWQVKARSVDVDIEEYSLLDDVTFSAPVFLDNLSISETNQHLSVIMGVYASSSQANWGGQLIRLPGFKGDIARNGGDLAVIMETVGLHEEASIEVYHNLDNGSGGLSLSNAGLSFESQQLSGRISPWSRAWDISAGTVTTDLQADWRQQDTEWQVTGQTSMRATGLAGAWNDTAFTGLSTSLEVELDTATGIAIKPSTIEVALIDMGLTVENITADFALQPNELSVDVENLRMTAFGGVITVDPFSFSTVSERNTLLIRANSIDLAEILSIREFEAIEISGRIGAELPVTIEGDKVTITGGTLTGEPPGGVIRYLPGLESDQTDASIIGLATRALSNFEYETLTSEVDYSADGDLNLQMHLRGRNPDLDSKRPVILNLGVENNIPQMLRSLQAARAVEEILERRLAQ